MRLIIEMTSDLVVPSLQMKLRNSLNKIKIDDLFKTPVVPTVMCLKVCKALNATYYFLLLLLLYKQSVDR